MKYNVTLLSQYQRLEQKQIQKQSKIQSQCKNTNQQDSSKDDGNSDTGNKIVMMIKYSIIKMLKYVNIERRGIYIKINTWDTGICYINNITNRDIINDNNNNIFTFNSNIYFQLCNNDG